MMEFRIGFWLRVGIGVGWGGLSEGMCFFGRLEGGRGEVCGSEKGGGVRKLEIARGLEKMWK